MFFSFFGKFYRRALELLFFIAAAYVLTGCNIMPYKKFW